MSDPVVTPEFRMSFPYVLSPDKKDKYSLTMLFPEGADLSELKALAKAALKEKWGDNLPKGLRSPFRDQGEKDYEGYEPGCIFTSARSQSMPGVINAKGKKIIDSSEIYPGCYGRAEVTAYAYDVDGNKGVAFGLNHVMKTRDGDQLGGGAGNPTDAFASYIDSGASKESKATNTDDLFD